MLRTALSVLLLCVTVTPSIMAAAVIDCQRPPQLVDPSRCCTDGGRDDVTESCAQRMGITGKSSDEPPTVEKATCLAECILSESKYMIRPETLDMSNIKADLYDKFSNDTIYAETMFEAFRRCQPTALRKMEALKQIPLGNAALQRACSPFAGMVLGCAYMEYFKNCPLHRWTENAECSLAKQFVTQCALGA